MHQYLSWVMDHQIEVIALGLKYFDIIEPCNFKWGHESLIIGHFNSDDGPQH